MNRTPTRFNFATLRDIDAPVLRFRLEILTLAHSHGGRSPTRLRPRNVPEPAVSDPVPSLYTEVPAAAQAQLGNSMVHHPRSAGPLIASLVLLAACSSGPTPAATPAPRSDTEAQSATPAPRTVQAGAPGEASRAVDATDISQIGGVAFGPADVHFMQGMIPHHAQALQMTAMVEERTRDPGLRALALRMEISQRDEIGLMARWLESRGQDVPATAAYVDPAAVVASLQHLGDAMDHGAMDHGAMQDMGAMPMMPGMLTPDQMVQLEAARDVEFERLFLQFMIQHHNGAVMMVDTLFATDGAGQESEIFQFASHVDADQRAEMDRMRGMLDARMQGPNR